MRMQLQPPVKILLYFAFLIGIYHFPSPLFWAIFVLSQGFAFSVEGQQYYRRCRQLRWLFLSIILVYAFSTPGEFVQSFSPLVWMSYEGILAGLRQVAIILLAIAGLAILFSRTKPVDMVAGLYYLLKPLQLVGVPATRIAIRLLLTLQYVDLLAKESTDVGKPVSRYFELIHEGVTDDVDNGPLQITPLQLNHWEYGLLASLLLLIIFMVVF